MTIPLTPQELGAWRDALGSYKPKNEADRAQHAFQCRLSATIFELETRLQGRHTIRGLRGEIERKSVPA